MPARVYWRRRIPDRRNRWLYAPESDPLCFAERPGKIPYPLRDPRRAGGPDDFGAKDSGPIKQKFRKRHQDLDSVTARRKRVAIQRNDTLIELV